MLRYPTYIPCLPDGVFHSIKYRRRIPLSVKTIGSTPHGNGSLAFGKINLNTSHRT